MSRLVVPVGASDHVQGVPCAPATLVEYGDFECPYCAETHPVIQAVQRRMGSRLRFVFRHFPLAEVHPHALAAARFAEAAGSEHVFWAAHDLLFRNSARLGALDLYAAGRSLGLDAALVARALSGAFDPHIEADFEGGVRSGVNGTPGLFINGLRYDGPRDLYSLLAMLEPSPGDAVVRGRTAADVHGVAAGAGR